MAEAVVIQFPSTNIVLGAEIKKFKEDLAKDFTCGEIVFMPKTSEQSGGSVWCCHTNALWSGGIQHYLHAEAHRQSDGTWHIEYLVMPYRSIR